MTECKIGSVVLRSPALLAPMAGVSDRAYRELCMDMGAGYCVSEMVSSKALSFHSKKSEELMEISSRERPCGIQIFGDEPSCMADAARHAMENHPDIIDINMGCPAPKISGNGSGSALMRHPQLCGEIVRAVVAVSDVPVTVKIRKGWDDESVNAVEIAKICEHAGASAITIHGRTRMQFYHPPVDYEIIRQVRHSVSIPVIANGDIDSAQKAKEVMERTDCDMVMIGRASMGNPWLFMQIKSYLEHPGQPLSYPDLRGKARRHGRPCGENGRLQGRVHRHEAGAQAGHRLLQGHARRRRAAERGRQAFVNGRSVQVKIPRPARLT